MFNWSGVVIAKIHKFVYGFFFFGFFSAVIYFVSSKAEACLGVFFLLQTALFFLIFYDVYTLYMLQHQWDPCHCILCCVCNLEACNKVIIFDSE